MTLVAGAKAAIDEGVRLGVVARPISTRLSRARCRCGSHRLRTGRAGSSEGA